MTLTPEAPADEYDDDWGLRRPPRDYVEAVYRLGITLSVARDNLDAYRGTVAEAARDAVVAARLAARDLLPRDRRARRARALATRRFQHEEARLRFLRSWGVPT
jgi:hypothetical protein